MRVSKTIGVTWFRRCSLCFAGFLVTTLIGCGGLPKTAEQNAADEQRSKASQALRMAESISEQGDPASARIFYMRAAALNPRQPEPLIGLARASASVGAYVDAAEAYEQALVIAPARTELHFEYGRALLALGRSREATDHFARFVQSAPADSRGYSALGIARDTSGDHANAQTAYLDGLEIAPDSISLRNNLALSLAFAGNHTDAMATLEELSGEVQQGPRIRQNLALVHAIHGNLQAAEALIRQDLPPTQVQATLSFYRSLQGLRGPALAQAVLANQIGSGEQTASGRRVAVRPANRTAHTGSSASIR